MVLMIKNSVIVALDTSDMDIAKKLIIDLKDDVKIFKVGLEYFMANTIYGMNALGSISMVNKTPSVGNPGTYWIIPELFLDLKFHDIPKTVHNAIAGIHDFRRRGQNITMTTVHADGGVEMMEAAVEAADGKFDILGVTLLTSIKKKNSTKIVLKRVEDALEAGTQGIVCSPKEIQKIRATFGFDFKIIVPGIRPTGTETHDQKRVGTPLRATQDGATHLVIGRPITQAADPKEAAWKLINNIDD